MPESDEALVDKIAKAEQQIFAACDLIPTTHWGFDEVTQEKLRQRKHKLVDEQLSKKEKKRLNNAQKGSMARSLGVSGTISEVFQWLAVSNVCPNLRVKTLAVKLEKPVKVNGEKVQQPQKSVKMTASSSDEDSDDEEAPPMTESSLEKAKPAGKPVATVKPTVRVEKEVEPEEDSGDDDDSTDEESAPVEKKGGQKRKSPVEMPTSAKKTKLDKELEKFENVDPSSLDPIESRHMAMLKLQKRLETMKQTRTGKKHEGAAAKKAAVAMAEKKLKRRMSKLQMKQRRAEEKKKVNGEEETPKTTKKEKEEPEIVNDDGKVVYSKFDFIVKDPKKKRLSTSEKKEKFTGKDYRSLLHKAEKRNEKLAELKEADPEKAQQMEEDIKWNRALKKAEGVKVKDNVELLKKGLRKKEKAKEKRLAKWDQRVEKVTADKTKKQDKRTTNIAKRADDKKKKKMAKLRKKGRIL